MKPLHAIAPYQPNPDQQRMMETIFNATYYTFAEPLPNGNIRYSYMNEVPLIMTARAIAEEIRYQNDEANREDIECEHENYDAEGYCESCEQYDQDYDTTLQQETR